MTRGEDVGWVNFLSTTFFDTKPSLKKGANYLFIVSECVRAYKDACVYTCSLSWCVSECVHAHKACGGQKRP